MNWKVTLATILFVPYCLLVVGFWTETYGWIGFLGSLTFAPFALIWAIMIFLFKSGAEGFMLYGSWIAAMVGLYVWGQED